MRTKWSDIGHRKARRRAWATFILELAVAGAFGLWIGYWLGRAF